MSLIGSLPMDGANAALDRAGFDLPEVQWESRDHPESLMFHWDPKPSQETSDYSVLGETPAIDSLKESLGRSWHARNANSGTIQSHRVKIISKTSPLGVSTDGRPILAEIVVFEDVDCVRHELMPDALLLLEDKARDPDRYANPMVLEVHKYENGGRIRPGRSSIEGNALFAMCRRAGLAFQLADLPEYTVRTAPLSSMRDQSEIAWNRLDHSEILQYRWESKPILETSDLLIFGSLDGTERSNEARARRGSKSERGPLRRLNIGRHLVKVVSKTTPLGTSSGGSPIWAEIASFKSVSCERHEFEPVQLMLLGDKSADPVTYVDVNVLEVHRYEPRGTIRPEASSVEAKAVLALCTRAGLPFQVSELPMTGQKDSGRQAH